jgi:L-alanine-DL-glutamate epimerase-like enolase superfamily enzyme
MYFLYRDALPNMIEEARAAISDGFSCIYLKVGLDPTDDIQTVRALRDALGPDTRIRIDANEMWSPGMAVRVIRQLEDCDLEFVEQPVLRQDVEGLAAVRRRVRTPIAADQAARTVHDLLRVIRLDAADVVCSDPGSAGGIGAARKHAAIAEAAGLPMFVHSNVEIGIGTAAAAHLAAAFPNCSYPSQTEYQFVRHGDVLAEPLTLESGHLVVPEGPGLGVEVDAERVNELAEITRASIVREKLVLSGSGLLPGP